MKANPSAPEGLALEGASAVLRGLPVESTTACAARLHPLPCRANAAHAEYSDRLLVVVLAASLQRAFVSVPRADAIEKSHRFGAAALSRPAIPRSPKESSFARRRR